MSPVETEPAASGAGLRLDVGRDDALARAESVIREAWASFDSFRVGQPAVDAGLRSLLLEGLPDKGTSAERAILDAARALDQSIAQPRPRYFAFIGSSGLEIAVIADALAACFDVNLAVWAGAASEVEAQAVRWAGELVGYPCEAGSFTSGGTVSNVTALTAARERALPGSRHDGLFGHRLALYCSLEVHYSVVRAAELLGIGSSGVRALPIDEHRRLRPDAVAAAIDSDRAAGIVPVAVVATAGTTLTGAVDPVDALADVCAQRNVWLHVDGAYGLPAARTPSAAPLFRGIERADSVTIDAHKWLYLPKACGVVLVRNRADLAAALGHEGSYLPHDHEDLHAADMTLEYSRPFRALKFWLALRVHGASAFLGEVERNLAQAQLLHRRVVESPDLEALPFGPQLSVVPFRHVPNGVEDLDSHNAEIVRRIQEGGEFWVAHAQIDGKTLIRPCIVNFRTSDDDVLAFVDSVERIGREICAG
ncbi:MAG TPA: aminotransferase class V-fold PLP-dependent enzyme [Gaiellaceae bacterium]|jgi:aromatic-L-amino-acid decarboxylase